jgi:hypothetical protein
MSEIKICNCEGKVIFCSPCDVGLCPLCIPHHSGQGDHKLEPAQSEFGQKRLKEAQDLLKMTNELDGNV